MVGCALWVFGKSGKRPREISRVRFAHEKTRIFGAHKCHPVMVLYGISLWLFLRRKDRDAGSGSGMTGRGCHSVNAPAEPALKWAYSGSSRSAPILSSRTPIRDHLLRPASRLRRPVPLRGASSASRADLDALDLRSPLERGGGMLLPTGSVLLRSVVSGTWRVERDFETFTSLTRWIRGEC